MNTTMNASDEYKLRGLVALMVVLGVAMGVWLLACGLEGVVVNGTSHAEERHGPEALRVRECLGKNGAYAVWKRPGGNWAQICQFEDLSFGIQIVLENSEELTAFELDEIPANAYWKVEEYMIQGGYVELDSVLMGMP